MNTFRPIPDVIKTSIEGNNLQSKTQISSKLIGNKLRMAVPGKTVSQQEMEAEWEVIQAAKESPAKFRPLYQKYYHPIFRFVYNRTGSEDLAGDIVAQVFMKAMQKIGAYQFKGVPFSAWLYRIASNEVTQYYRNNSKRRVVSIEERHISDLIEDSEEDDFESKKAKMLAMLKDLKESDLKMVELRFFEQRSFKEIANILGMTESNAKVKTYRIIERMRKKVRP